MDRREPRLVSVVAPMYDEEETATAFLDRTVSALDGLPFELVLVDDGSADKTLEIITLAAARDPRVRVLQLSRNFGHQVALTAGLDHARGDLVVTIDADLQDPPEVIPQLVDRWRQGIDVVYAVRTDRLGETAFKLATAGAFYRLMSRLAQVELRQDAGDFRAMDRRALDALLAMRERNRYLRGMTAWVGFAQAGVPYARDARYAGQTKYTLRRMVRLSFDAIASFSHVPLQIATLVGMVCAGIAFVLVPVTVGMRIAGQFVPGITSTLLAVLGLGGIQLVSIGLIGEYVGRTYDEVKQRPLYVVAHESARDDEDAETGPSR